MEKEIDLTTLEKIKEVNFTDLLNWYQHDATVSLELSVLDVIEAYLKEKK